MTRDELIEKMAQAINVEAFKANGGLSTKDAVTVALSAIEEAGFWIAPNKATYQMIRKGSIEGGYFDCDDDISHAYTAMRKASPLLRA